MYGVHSRIKTHMYETNLVRVFLAVFKLSCLQCLAGPSSCLGAGSGSCKHANSPLWQVHEILTIWSLQMIYRQTQTVPLVQRSVMQVPNIPFIYINCMNLVPFDKLICMYFFERVAFQGDSSKWQLLYLVSLVSKYK